MPAVIRKDVDPSAGHGYPPRPADQGSPNVIVNGHPSVRVGDHYPTHCQGNHCHDGHASEGSPVVIVNGKQMTRIGDAIDCGDIAASGSGNVFAGSSPFPMFVSLEPGVFLVAGEKVYDNTKEGQVAIIKEAAKVYPQPTQADAPEPTKPTEDPKFQSCDQFPKIITAQDMAIKVSKNFILGTCKNVPCDQRGLTANQIACNWAALCYTLLDPIYDQFKFSFNSGFRTVASGMGNTDHGLGCAADISAGSTEKTIAMFKWIVASGLPFSQVIYEKHNSAWVHISYRGKQQSSETRIMCTLTGSAPYTHASNLPDFLRA